jgi:hypothetical protein
VTPLEELKKKIHIFENKKNEVLAEKDDFSLLLDGAVKNIMTNVLDEDLKAFRQELILKVSENFERSYSEHSGMALNELRERLEGLVVTEVKQAFASWRGPEDEKLAKTFETACKRFIIKIDGTVDSLLKFSAELFAVPFDIVTAEAIWSTKSAFYYRFKEQPVGIEIVASSLTLLLPKFIGEKIILKKVKEYLNRAIDIQTAKAGCDFEERLNKSKLDFRWEMFQRIGATIEGIAKALEKGMSMKDKGEEVFEERKAVLLETEKKMNDIKERLIQIRREISA